VQQKRYLTSAELIGIRAVDVYLLRLMKTRKTRPPFVKNVVGLFEDVDLLLDEHEDDDQVRAVDGRPVLLWPDELSTSSEAADDDESPMEEGSRVEPRTTSHETPAANLEDVDVQLISETPKTR
jgi:hypothetical protein